MVGPEQLCASLQDCSVLGFGLRRLAKVPEHTGVVMAACQGVGVVRSEQLPSRFQDYPILGLGLYPLAEVLQDIGQVVAACQGVGMVEPEQPRLSL